MYEYLANKDRLQKLTCKLFEIQEGHYCLTLFNTAGKNVKKSLRKIPKKRLILQCNRR